jgi:ABC-type Zn uptake system ZnuABC Zn-binding protein ZnuA
MSIHIHNRLLSNRNILIISIVAIIVGFVFVNLLIFYFPRDNRINLNGITSMPIQSIPKITKNQVATTDLNIYNVAKAISKNGIPIVYAGPVSKLNDDYEATSDSFAQILDSKFMITSGQDKWLERKNSGLEKLQTLDLSNSITIKNKIPAIDLSFGNSQSSQTYDNQETLDYSYLMDENNLKISIENISNFLIQLDPTNKDKYFKNQIELTTQINNIETQFSNITLCNNSPIITNSVNLNYLAQKYGLELSVFKNFDPIRPEPNQIKYLSEFAKSKNTNSFFIDQKIPLVEYNNLKNSLGLEIYFISDFVYPDIADTLAKNLENLKKSQGC